MAHDVSKLIPTDIESIELSFEDTLTVIYRGRTSDGKLEEYRGVTVKHTASIPLRDETPRLCAASKAFADVVIKALQHGAGQWEGEVRCSTCTGACCATYDMVAVTAADLERAKGLGVELDVMLYKNGESWNGSVGMIRSIEGLHPMTGKLVKYLCPHLGADGRCTVYEARPQVCRDYNAEACGDVYEDGRIHLKVVQ